MAVHERWCEGVDLVDCGWGIGQRGWIGHVDRGWGRIRGAVSMVKEVGEAGASRLHQLRQPWWRVQKESATW